MYRCQVSERARTAGGYRRDVVDIIYDLIDDPLDAAAGRETHGVLMSTQALSVDLARSELRRATVAAFGVEAAERLLRTFESDVVATANAITSARYQALVGALAKALPPGIDDVHAWLDGDDLDERPLRARVEAVEPALGPILDGREGDGSLDFDALAVLADDVESAASSDRDSVSQEE